MKLATTISCLGALALLWQNASANTPLYSETFDSAAAIADWTGQPTWSETLGAPGGAVIVANNIQPTNKNFTVEIPLNLEKDSDITITFDAIKLADVGGVFHFYAEPEGFPQFFINFNVEVLLNSSTYTPISFVAEKVPASATTLSLRFEMITGAVQGAEISVGIDNLIVVGPRIDPEGTWKGYDLMDGFWVDNVGQLGLIYVAHDPWLYSAALEQWVYLPEDSVPGIDTIWFSMPASPVD